MSNNSTEPHGADEWTLLAEAFPASPTAPQGSDWERTTSATCGPKCCASYAKLPRVSSWAKTFAASLIGTAAWSSRRCALIWKLRGTKYGRAYFLLQASAHPTDGTGFGLLLTPTAVQTCEHPDEMQARAQAKGYRNGTKYGSLTSQVTYGMLLKTPCAADAYTEGLTKKEQTFGNSGTLAQEVQTGFIYQRGMLPTPIAGDWKGQLRSDGTALMLSGKASLGMLPTPKTTDAKQLRKLNANGENIRNSTGTKYGVQLTQLAEAGMLGTPTVRFQSRSERFASVGMNPQELADKIAGTGSQLNPRFVAEMMGFPVNWTELPFQSGAMNQSKPTETQ